MGARFAWWQQLNKHRVAFGVVSILLLVVIALIFIGYYFDWTGFNGYNQVTITRTLSGTNAGTVTRTEVHQLWKGLWDWLQLLGVLAIPVVVGFGAVWFTTRQEKVAHVENTDNQRETALQAYIDKMSELLIEKKLRDSAEEDEVRVIARVRTMTILPRLDATRKSSVLLFLHESGLIEKGKCIINLSGANLSGANLRTDNLSEANLSGADLSDADLFGANLSGANMHEVNLNKANMQRVNLNGANLSDAIITTEQLDEVESLKGATMPDGSKHP